MKQYIKAEWELYKKNTVTLIMGFISLVVYAILLLFTGVGGAHYAAAVSLVGYVVFLFFFMMLYFSPASFWKNKSKVAIPTEQLLLTLGESKRTFVKIRILALFVGWFGMMLLIALFQIPAFLIAGEAYSLWYFGIELMAVTAFVFLTMPAFALLPHRVLNWALPGVCGFCGGLAGGLIGDAEDFEEAEEAFGMFAMVAIVGVALGLLCMLYRYVKTVRDERRGLRKVR
ncbi:MAG: hypothetical protein IJW37_02270 [Lachnospiraceae bacterium]|nr:hypothetical protein [Lachnospiraceae bacterium]